MTQPPRVRYCGRRELAPEVAELITRLRQMRSELQRACKPLRDGVADLERDWNIRSFDFWQHQLTALQAAQSCIAPWQHWVNGSIAEDDSLLLMHPIRYDLMLAVNKAEALIDRAGIAITSYQEVCSSTEECHLHQRQRVLKQLQDLDERVQTILKKTGVQGQRACIRAYEANTNHIKQEGVPS